MRAWVLRHFPVPEPLALGLMAGAVVELWVPSNLPGVPAWTRLVLGWPLLTMGVAFATWSVAVAGPSGMRGVDRLVQEGPYARGRNPMYGAWMLGATGAAVLLESLWMVAFVLLGAGWIDRVVIPREEHHLTSRYGDAYARYRSRTRRYL